jgi:putative ABC transport system permease protein
VLADVRYALRLFRRTPSFTATAVLTLALGMGVTTAIFAVVYGVLFRPLPISDGDRVVAVFRTTPSLQRWRDQVSGVRFDEWRARTDAFADMAATSRKPFDLMLGKAAERVEGEVVSGNFFEMLGVSAVHGRVFTRGDDAAGDAVPCVISEALWRQHFLADPAVLGRTISSAGTTLTVVGVVGGAFARWRYPAEIWAPYKLTPALLAPAILSNDGYGVLHVLGRLKRGVTIDRAGAQLASLDAQLDAAFGGVDATRDVNVVGLRDSAVDARLRRSLWFLGISAVLILILASANVGSQLLARSVPRRREMATRTALGGTRLRLTMQLATEATLLATVGGCAGVLIAAWTIPILTSVAPPDIARVSVIALDRAAWVFLLLSTLLVIVAIGTLPALRSRDVDVVSDLRGASVSTRKATTVRAQALLVVGQMLVAMPVVAAAALMVTSFVRLQAIDPGFETRHLLTMTISLPSTTYRTPEAALKFRDRVLAGTRSIPGVEAAAIGNAVDYLARSHSDAGVSITIEGGRRFLNGQAEQAPFTPGRRRVTADYFRALGLRVIAGRGLTDADRSGGALVGVINESMARMHWPGQSAIGKRVNFESVRPGRPLVEPWTEIVGVVADARQHRFDVRPRPEIYTPLAQTPYLLSTLTLLVRSATPPATVAPAVRQAIRDIDVTVPAFDMRTMTSIIDEATATPRYAANLASLFAVLALTLAAVGTYGLGAFASAQRVREIGIRIALGATRADVLRLTFREGFRPAAAGIAAGTLAAVLATRLLSALLYDVGPSDPLILASAVIIVLVVALCGSYLPARRAARVDPVVALRAD